MYVHVCTWLNHTSFDVRVRLNCLPTHFERPWGALRRSLSSVKVDVMNEIYKIWSKTWEMWKKNRYFLVLIQTLKEKWCIFTVFRFKFRTIAYQCPKVLLWRLVTVLHHMTHSSELRITSTLDSCFALVLISTFVFINFCCSFCYFTREFARIH